MFPNDELEATYTNEKVIEERGSMFRKQTDDGSLTSAQTSLKHNMLNGEMIV